MSCDVGEVTERLENEQSWVEVILAHAQREYKCIDFL